MISLILGSSSPRRKEILSLFNIPFHVEAPNFDEDAHPYHGDPAQYVTELSACKSFAINNMDQSVYILTADTIVYRNGVVYGKPKNREDAHRILSELNGKIHQVYTGISLRKGSRIETLFDKTDVELNGLSEHELEMYLDKTEWHDKAGAYAIQDKGALIVKKIDGCYYNVKGLPITTLKTLFSKFAIDLWDYL